jgi:thiol:disulfide interchange protein DsbD
MKLFKLLALAILLFAGVAESKAQVLKDPTTWTYEAKRKFGNHFELFFHVKLAGNWHVYAIDPGGDESLIPPTFTFEKAKGLKLVGKIKETSKPITEKAEGLDKPVNYFNGEATFVQEVEVPSGSAINIKGRHQYQVCNDRMCLPPKTKTFLFTVKP